MLLLFQLFPIFCVFLGRTVIYWWDNFFSICLQIQALRKWLGDTFGEYGELQVLMSSFFSSNVYFLISAFCWLTNDMVNLYLPFCQPVHLLYLTDLILLSQECSAEAYFHPQLKSDSFLLNCPNKALESYIWMSRDNRQIP